MRLLGLGFVLALAGCTASASPAKGVPPAQPSAASAQPSAAAPAQAAAHEPDIHRPKALACTHKRGPGAANRPKGSCKSDADCKKGHTGRCVEYYSGGRMPPSNECSYDDCFTDGDCGNSAVCECGHEDQEVGEGHHCIAASCRTDRECGAGGFCSPSAPLCSRRHQPGHYYCHRRGDECMTDSDCPAPVRTGYGPQAGGCRYSAELGHWACATEECPVG